MPGAEAARRDEVAVTAELRLKVISAPKPAIARFNRGSYRRLVLKRDHK